MDSDKKAREIALTDWAKLIVARQRGDSADDLSLHPASDDASFRRYFRGTTTTGQFIFVDAPPAQEDSAPFIRVAALLRAAGLNAPEVIESDLQLGFMMLTDLGETQLQDLLNQDLLNQNPVNQDASSRLWTVYEEALLAIHQMQRIDAALPRYNEALLRQEMNLFPEWFLERQLGIQTSPAENALIESVFARLVASALEQPALFVHRDFHCRNIMVQPDLSPGIIDFQDAVIGPVTYDLVSLLRDCYHRFAPADLDCLLASFHQQLMQRQQMPAVDMETFRRWFDWMGMQRHLKCAGIFSRLNIRDNKPRYLGDIPLVFSYLQEVAHTYPEFATFGDWLDERIAPSVAAL